MPDASPLPIGVLISGSGTNLQAIIDAIANDGLNVEIVKVLSSRPDAYGLKRAAEAGIPTVALTREVYENAAAANALIAQQFKDAGAQYLVMAGYMRKIGPEVLAAFPDRVLNLHPALLPSFPGAHGIQDAFDAGVKVTGVTVHFTNEAYDKGPIIAQRAVRVREGESVEELEARIHEAEYEIYPWVLGHLAAGDITITSERKVVIANA